MAFIIRRPFIIINFFIIMSSFHGLIRRSYGIHLMSRRTAVAFLSLPRHGPITTRSASVRIRMASTSAATTNGNEDEGQGQQGTFGAKVPFKELGLSPSLLHALEKAGKSISTHIQALSIPPIVEGDDVIIGSETGAGKTLAYLLPLIERCLRLAQDPAIKQERQRELEYYKDRKSFERQGGDTSSISSPLYEEFPWETPRVIVLVPNRPLSDQVLRMANEVLSLDPTSLPKIEALLGSADEWPYRPISRPAPEVLVCTPASLSSFDREIGLFSRVTTLVIDEADMLLEGDYGRHLDRILVAFKRADKVHFSRQEPFTQYILSAATIPTYGLKSVEELVKKRFPKAVRVNTDLMHRHHPKLIQAFVQAPVSLDAKIQMLIRVLQKLEERGADGKRGENDLPLPKTMIFANTAAAAQTIYNALIQEGYKAVPFHKDVRANDRETFLEEFRQSRIPLLVCTDLASRGLDIPDVKQVIQVEFAPNVVQHLHRIGRAVRAGREGRSVNFYDEGSEDLVESLQIAGDESLDRSFSRQRGFRKKIKKYGKDYYRKGSGGGSSTEE